MKDSAILLDSSAVRDVRSQVATCAFVGSKPWIVGILAILCTSVADAAPPSLAQCATPQYALYIAGSSAAQNAFANAVGS